MPGLDLRPARTARRPLTVSARSLWMRYEREVRPGERGSAADLRTYPRDVATASASVRAIGEKASADDPVDGQHAA